MAVADIKSQTKRRATIVVLLPLLFVVHILFGLVEAVGRALDDAKSAW